MQILFLGPDTSPVLAHLRQTEAVTQTANPVSDVQQDFIVSHGYRHILPPHLCERFDGRAINLHISYLPWNRGADPNFWSHFDRTPKGVTIHHIARGLDTGDIIVQQEVEFEPFDTLATSYEKLQQQLVALFVAHWPTIRIGVSSRAPQMGRGSYHRSADKVPLNHLLTNGLHTSIEEIGAADLALRHDAV